MCVCVFVCVCVLHIYKHISIIFLCVLCVGDVDGGQ